MLCGGLSDQRRPRGQVSLVVPYPVSSHSSCLATPPKFDSNKIGAVSLRCTGGETGATGLQVPKVGSLALSLKEVGDDIAKATGD